MQDRLPRRLPHGKRLGELGGLEALGTGAQALHRVDLGFPQVYPRRPPEGQVAIHHAAADLAPKELHPLLLGRGLPCRRLGLLAAALGPRVLELLLVPGVDLANALLRLRLLPTQPLLVFASDLGHRRGVHRPGGQPGRTLLLPRPVRLALAVGGLHLMELPRLLKRLGRPAELALELLVALLQRFGLPGGLQLVEVWGCPPTLVPGRAERQQRGQARGSRHFRRHRP